MEADLEEENKDGNKFSNREKRNGKERKSA